MPALLLPAALAFAVSLAAVPITILVARRVGAVDHPGGRRLHLRVTPRLGGVAILGAFFVAFAVFLPDIAPHFKHKQLAGFSLAALILLVTGVWDDVRGVSPRTQLLSHIACGVVLVGVGMGIDEVTNPLGGKLSLDWTTFTIPFQGISYHLNLPADLITVAWVVLVINSMNWIDGLDGLAGGVSLISALTIALLSLSAVVSQSHIALLAAMVAGAAAGFLVFNWHPAKIFMGTVGSTFLGFTLATLAIISGGKVATALLVLGFPILDAIAVILKRLKSGRAAAGADNRHLHHLLLARGFSVRQAALSIYLLCAAFGGLALLTQTTRQKAVAFAALVVLLGIVLAWLARHDQQPDGR